MWRQAPYSILTFVTFQSAGPLFPERVVRSYAIIILDKMVKYISVLLASFFAIFCIGAINPAYADICSETGFSDPALCGSPNTNEEGTLIESVGNVLNAIYGVIAIVAVVMIVIAGIKYSTSQGDPGKVQSAKNTILYAVIGLVITISAFAITAFILSALGGSSTGGGGGGGGGNGGGNGGGGGGQEIVEAAQIYLSVDRNVINIGETAKITVDYYPDYAENRTVTFTSSNTSIATVSSNGTVTGKKEGNVTITAKSANGKTSTVNITVKKIVYDQPKLAVGKTTLLDEETTTATVDNKKSVKSFKSSDSSIFVVDNNGAIRAKKPGSATLTTKVIDLGNKEVTLTKKITVREIKVLWVGNSKTYVQDIDTKFVTIAKNRGYSVNSTRVTKGGKTLLWNYNNQGTNIKKAYDYVILQEQTDAALQEDTFYNGALAIAKAVKAKNGNVKVFVRKAWILNSSSGSTRNAANTVATNVSNRIASATGVWSSTTSDGNALYEMHDKGYSVFGDERHQNALGAYTAAACISSKVLGFDPQTISTKAGISASDSAITAAKNAAKNKCYNK